MIIRHYLYNAFVIESDRTKIAIDPGALFFYFFRFTTLIPKSEWEGITHIFVTHGDPDHFWHADRVAKISGAKFICNKTMVRKIDGQKLMLGPRSKGLSFTKQIDNLTTISVDESIELDNMIVKGLKATHGSLLLKVGPFSKVFVPGPHERVGWGALGYSIHLNNRTIVNLGDTLLQTEEWKSINEPDVLMIPIGGKVSHNTMDEMEALQAVALIKPKLVIPCHYNCPSFFTSKYNHADAEMFKNEVEKLGSECVILNSGESVSI